MHGIDKSTLSLRLNETSLKNATYTYINMETTIVIFVYPRNFAS